MLVALALGLAGCTPAGPRALLQGKKNLDQGDPAEAVVQLQRATTLMPANAAAWNYYGVALQRSGRPDAVVAAYNAYKQALELNRDLVEVHFNLGTLWLEQNRPGDAQTEFTAYTLRRPNEAAGWLKLASTQLKLGEIVPAERSYSTVLALKPAEPEIYAETYNGLGLARIQHGKPQDAAQFFAAAVKMQPDFGPALLNLATTKHVYLRDDPAALKNYQAFLALSPRPANWDEVNALATSLEQSLAPSTPAPVPAAKPVAPAPSPKPKAVAPAGARTAVTPRSKPAEELMEPETAPIATRPPATHGVNRVVLPAPAPPAQVVTVPPAPKIVTAPAAASAADPAVVVAEPEQVPENKPGLLHKLFGDGTTESAPEPVYLAKGLTPLPADETAARPAAKPAEPAPVKFPRYHYLSPRPPAAGDRPAANGAFTKAREFEQDENWGDALQWYKTAAQLDPAWFEAQYNTAVLAHRLRNYSLALPGYENALAIQPGSTDGRYNFALALSGAGYVTDAVAELKKILAANPGEVRAHLALANLAAQTLHDPAQARPHYLKVLELDSQNPHASDIRFWLSSNPQ
jgi:tetratricopeptide (TPR) repeat protein